MKKSRMVYITPREARGLLNDASGALSDYHYQRSKKEYLEENGTLDGAVKYRVTTIVERVEKPQSEPLFWPVACPQGINRRA